MGTELQVIEGRLKSFVHQFHVEYTMFDRLVYKNKNQHRRSIYFQYLLKVRRDTRLLKSIGLELLVASCFDVINGSKPKAKVHLLESLKRSKCDYGIPNFMERLLGAARLLSQIVEPIIKAASELSGLLARTWFLEFSLVVLASLGRLRVLTQQMLLDVVSIFNKVSSLSRKKQSVKIMENGIEVFRECFPVNKDTVILECEWMTDKFVLHERMCKRDAESQDKGDADGDGDEDGDVSIQPPGVQYSVVDSVLGVDDSELEKTKKEEDTAGKACAQRNEDEKDTDTGGPSVASEHREQIEGSVEVEDNQKVPPKSESPSSSSKAPAPKSSSGTVAFVSVKRPAPSSPPAFVSVKRPAILQPQVEDHLTGASKVADKED